MQKAKNGDYVTVEYDGTLDNGEAFESSSENGPLSFVIGQNSVFPSFEKAVIGMAPGETRDATVGSAEAYGPRREELVQTIDRSALGKEIDPQPGMVVGIKMEQEGQTHQIPATVVEVNDDQITIDYNHPLAGRDLQYKITLQAISEADDGEDMTIS